MHRIQKIELVAEDATTDAPVKLIHSTAGDPFYSRRCAYNTTSEMFEKKMREFGVPPFKHGIPLRIETLRYLGEKHPTSRLLPIKDLTRSRLSKNPHEHAQFYQETQRIKKLSMTSTRVVVYYFQLTADEWRLYTLEDVETLTQLLLQAGVPHVTIVAHPHFSYDENKALFDKMAKDLQPDQTLFGQLCPSMKKKDGKPTLQHYFTHSRVIGILITALTPSNQSNLYYYSYCFNNAPKGKLMCAADVPDTFGGAQQRLSTHLALRRFGFDITSRKVTFNLSGFSFPVHPEKTLIYDDTTGGMLAESTQILWHGRSAVDFIMDNFPANTGLDFREYVLAFNFEELNKTGLKECQSVLERQHEIYIKDRIYLQTFYAIPAEEE